jgi:hypothetical protein
MLPVTPFREIGAFFAGLMLAYLPVCRRCFDQIRTVSVWHVECPKLWFVPGPALATMPGERICTCSSRHIA